MRFKKLKIPGVKLENEIYLSLPYLKLIKQNSKQLLLKNLN